jgi:two-component sensor histidine kinase
MDHKASELTQLTELIAQLMGECALKTALFDSNGALVRIDASFPGYTGSEKDYFQSKNPAIVAQLEPLFKTYNAPKRKVFRCFVETAEGNNELISFEARKLTWQNHHYILLLQKKADAVFFTHSGVQQMLHASGLYLFEYNLLSNCFEGANQFFAHFNWQKNDLLTLQQFLNLIKTPGKEVLSQIIESAINFGEKGAAEVEILTEKQYAALWVGVIAETESWPIERITFIVKDHTQAYLLQQEARRLQLLTKSTGLHFAQYTTEALLNPEQDEGGIPFLAQKHIDILRNKEVVSLIEHEPNQVRSIDLVPLFNTSNKLSSVLVAEKDLQKAIEASDITLSEKAGKIAEMELLVEQIRQDGASSANSIAALLGTLLKADAVLLYEAGSKKALWKNLSEWKNPKGMLPLNGLPEAYNPALYADFTKKIATNGYEAFFLSAQSPKQEKIADAKEWLLEENGFKEVIWMPLSHYSDKHLVAEMWFTTTVKKTNQEILRELGNMLSKPAAVHPKTTAELEKLKIELSKKELLLKEVNHRAKNNLALVAGLLKIQASTLKDAAAKAALKESQARIKSISLLHEELYQNAGVEQNIQLDSYLRKLINNIVLSFSNIKTNLKLQLIPVELPSRKVVTVGLLVNEILTNAFKHGLKNVAEGEITVATTLEGDKITLFIADNGPGFSEDFNPDTLDSLGFTLIREFSEQIGGNWKFYSDNGAKFSITFPIHK